MKWKQYDIFLLLGCLFIFSCGISWLQLGKKGQAITMQTLVDAAQLVVSQKNNGNETILSSLTDNEILIYLKALIASRSVEKIVSNLNGLSLDKVLRIYDLIVKQKSSPLLPIDKKELLILLAATFLDRTDQDAILQYYLAHDVLHTDGPLLVTAAHLDGHKILIPMVYGWYQRALNQEDFQKIVDHTYLHAIQKDEINLFKRLLEDRIPLSADLATRLLWEVVNAKKNPSFVRLLADYKADLDAIENGFTPLIRAATMNNYPMVEALLKAGANPNVIADDAIGSALQSVMRLVLDKSKKGHDKAISRLIEIELLLRHFGARE